MDEKYKDNAAPGQTGSNWAKSEINGYYRVEKRTILSTNTITIDKFQVDANTYANILSSSTTLTLPDSQSIKIDTYKETQSCYDYEMELNDSKRKIKLLKPEFVRNVEQEFRRVIA
jgi:hypothetical protein